MLLRPTFVDNIKGIGYSFLILVTWTFTLTQLLTLTLSEMSPVWIVPAMLWQTFLFSGLFITAHDSMHGTIAPSSPFINRAIGTIAVKLYALFSYKKLRVLHDQHHRYVGTDKDPDHHDGTHKHVVLWYLHFLKGYLSIVQLVGMALIFNVLRHGLGIGLPNLLLFWVIPSCLSTIQLFYFGTYLPHHESEENDFQGHHSRSNSYSEFWSFVTCYHFGYHWEHHEKPYVPWWKLPKARRMLRKQSLEQKFEESQSPIAPSQGLT